MTDTITLKPPQKRDSTYLLADYVEILCLANPDGEITLDDAVSRVYKSVEYEAEHEAKLIDGHDSADQPEELTDMQIAKGRDWFLHLAFRQEAFEGFYPFCLEGDTLRMKSSCLSISHAFYIFLLVCSKLGTVSKRKEGLLTTQFEAISQKAFSLHLPTFTVHCLGKTPKGREFYPNKLKDAIYTLCEYINEKPIFDPENFPDKNTGDGGLDLVAFKLFGDTISSNMVCFAQCACGPDNWEKKQTESHYNRWKKRIRFVHPTANFMFTPVCFRGDDGRWYNEDKIEDSVLVDRLRICSVLKESLGDLSELQEDLLELVQIFLDYEEF